MTKNGQNLAILAKIAILSVFCLYLPNVAINFRNSGIETTLVVFFEKIIVYIPEKFWDNQNLAICGQNLAIFWPKLTVLKVTWFKTNEKSWKH